jgi:hypothetical protein
MISEHDEMFAGKSIREYESENGIVNPSDTAYRISIDFDAHDEGSTFPDLFARYLADPLARQTTALVIGDWGGASMGNNSTPVIEALVAASEKLLNLTALFIGDMISEESEISWIQLTDMSPLWDAYPLLEHFRVRGGEGLTLGRLRLPHLKSLVIESGGLNAEVVREVGAAELPELEHLEIWLGDDGYGATTEPADLAPILSGTKFPKLNYLGLRDSCIADDVAAAVAIAPVMRQIATLDLSLGTLTDMGAQALLASPYLKRLTLLDLHFHYISDAVVDQLKRTGIEVNIDDRQEGYTYKDEIQRYVSVSE